MVKPDNESGSTESTVIYKLHQAAYKGNIDSLRALLRNGEDVDCIDEQGNTALVLAYLGKTKQSLKETIIDLLLDYGANVNAVNDDGDSVLHVLVKATFHTIISNKMIEKLIAHGADRTLVDRENLNPSQLAFQRNNHKLGTFLLFYSLD